LIYDRLKIKKVYNSDIWVATEPMHSSLQPLEARKANYGNVISANKTRIKVKAPAS
jgi:hypothetical protein